MGTNTLTDYSSQSVVVADRIDQYRNALNGDIVPRNSTSGVPQAEAGKCGTQTYPFSEANFTTINIGGTAFDPNNLVTANNQIRSGATRTGSAQPLFLQADGSTNEATLLATTTNLVLVINGSTVTFESDVTIASLTTAPSTNNTCLINNAQFSGQNFTKYVRRIDYDAAGSEITGLDGEFAAFSVGSTEYFIARIDNTNSRLDVYQRGFFFDSSNNPVDRVALSNNDTITLMKLGWVYADSTGTSASVGYTTPTYSATQPSSAVINDYWYDQANNIWKRYDGSAWQTVNRTLIGWVVINTSNCVASRCVDITKNYSDVSTIKLEKASNSTAQSVDAFDNYISVYGNDYLFNGQITWDMTSNLESGVVEANNTLYYFYITNTGDIKISDERPNYRKELRGVYHPYHTWRWVGTINNDGSGNLEDAEKDYVGGVQFITTTGNSEVLIPDWINYIRVSIVAGGNSGGNSVFGDNLVLSAAHASGTAQIGDKIFGAIDYHNNLGTDVSCSYFFNNFNGTSYGSSQNAGQGSDTVVSELFIGTQNNFNINIGTGSGGGTQGACLIEYIG